MQPFHFTTARARNAGFNRMRKLTPDLRYVQFMDGDCELNNLWPEQALSFLETHKNVGVVCGRLRSVTLSAQFTIGFVTKG